MTDFNPPGKDALFAIRSLSGIDRVLQLANFSDFDIDVIEQVLEEAGKFAAEVLAPINIPGDQAGARLQDGGVISSPGFAEAYQQFLDNGWQSLEVAPDYDGMGMPGVVAAAAMEYWQAACLSFSLAPMLTSGAITAINAHGTDALKAKLLPKMSNGAWTGTMNLTEPQAGSDLSVVATRAVPDGDLYRLTGSKIFITWGDQEFTENVIHLVLARLPDAPDGVRGLSLFAVPKFLINDDGSPGERNDVFVAGIEHKLGIHASPTCVMAFGEQQGAVAYLVGEENEGLACMFTMMNHARISVGIQGLGISERAYQLARAYARERKQGRTPGIKGSVTIVHHPDVRRMLLLMKSQVEAMRAVAYYTAGTVDLAHFSADEVERERAARRAALLTPVLKAWATETAQEVTSLGVQIHGGMGYVEETGAAQHMRDARILTIYEGTTGIQAMDFAGRKVMADEGHAIGEFIAEVRSLDKDLADHQALSDVRAAVNSSVELLESAAAWLLKNGPDDPYAPGAASVNFLMLAGVVAGGWQMARAALAVSNGGDADSRDPAFAESKLATAHFYATHVLPRAHGLHAAATAGSEVLMRLPAESF